MRRDACIILGSAAVAVAIGVAIYLSNPAEFSGTASVIPSSQPSGSHSSPSGVSFTELAHGQTSNVTKRVNYVITSKADLGNLWKMIGAAGTPPTVDFASKQVIAVFAGNEPTTGYAITVSKVVDAAKRTVTITTQKPAASCVTGQTVTSPYQLVIVPATQLPFAHVDEVTTSSCAK